MVPGLYNKSDSTLVRKEKTDPTLKNESAHNKYYRDKAIPKLTGKYKAVHDSIANSGRSQADSDAIIALAGGTPKYEAPEKHVPKTVVYGKIGVDSDAGKRKPSGFRYKNNKPANGSITKRLK